MSPDALRLLDKAGRSIRATELLLNSGEIEIAVGRAYYAMFYAASALLESRNLGFRKHSAVHAAFSVEFVRTGRVETKYHRWLLDAFDQRTRSDYGAGPAPSVETAARILTQARDFVATVRAMIVTPDQPPAV